MLDFSKRDALLDLVKRNAIVCYLGVVVLALLTVGVAQAQPIKHVGHAPQLALTDVVKSEDVAAPGGTRFEDPVHVRHAGHASQFAAAVARTSEETAGRATDATSPLASRAPAIHVGHAAQLSHTRSRG